MSSSFPTHPFSSSQKDAHTGSLSSVSADNRDPHTVISSPAAAGSSAFFSASADGRDAHDLPSLSAFADRLRRLIFRLWMDSRLRQCLFDTFLLGLAAHAAYFFGGISYHDDVVCTYDVGATHIFGRFTLGLLGKLTRLPFGGSNYSLPWFGGLVSLLFLALSSYLMVCALHITSRLLSFLLCAIVAVFPVLTATFAYGFTAPYYMLAFFLACLSAFFLAGRTSLPSLAAGVILCGLMIGIYQAYLPVLLSFEVLILLSHEWCKKDRPFRFWLHALAGTVLGFLLYLLLMKLSLRATGKELYAYRGLDTMGAGAWNFSYPERIAMAYRMFFSPDSFRPYRGSDDYLLFMWSMRPVYRLLVLVILLLAVFSLIRMLRGFLPKRERLSVREGFTGKALLPALRMAVLFMLFPLCANFIFVMTDFDVYSLMLYGEVMIFVLGILLAQWFRMGNPKAPLQAAKRPSDVSRTARTTATPLQAAKKPSRTASGRHLFRFSVSGGLSFFLSAVLLYSVLFYVRYDNLCYYKAGRMQEEAVSYDTALIARIQETEGYDPSLPICFVHDLEKDTSFLSSDPELAAVTLTPYNGNEIINDYSWVNFLRVHCGFAPSVIEDSGQYDAFLKEEQVPRYPVSGSIRIVDGVIVVNF